MNKVIAYNIPGSGLGNRMFINALAYIISLKTGRSLITTPIEFFNKTKINTSLDTINNPLYTRQQGDQYVDMEKIISHQGDIIVNSFAQRQEYYSEYRDELRDFFIEATNGGTKHSSTVLYIRNGDYRAIGAYIGLENYYKLLNSINFTELTIVVEHIDEDVKAISEKYNAKIVSSKNILEDFLFVKNAKNIIMSQSTFAWWAAFLGDPDKVYVPLSVKNESIGTWYTEPEKDDVDLSLKYSNYNYITI